MTFLQDFIHKIEVAGSMRLLRYVLSFLLAALLLITYNLRVARNFSTQEAMDAAQLARNISRGRGYTTLFVRPLSLHLVAQRNEERLGIPETRRLADYSRIKEAHPDIANPPVYPVVLAGLMKLMPFDYSVSTTKSFWSSKGHFWRYQPEFMIGWFNQLLFMIVIALTYFWARRLFDLAVARTAAVVLLGSEILWNFSTSGLSTMLLILIFMGAVWCLTLLDRRGTEPTASLPVLILLSAAIGLLIGLGGLTRYGFAGIIIPALIFVVLYSGPRRIVLSLVVLGAFLAVMTPWIVRNYHVSGTPFGTASYSMVEGGAIFSGEDLGRSLNPDIPFLLRPVWLKFLISARKILQQEFFLVGGGWITALFLVGLMLGFRSPTLRRLRYFLMWSLGLLFVVQATGRTQLTEDSPGINSENYLVVLLPLVVVYGVSLFYVLLDQVHFPTRHWRYGTIILFGLLSYLPVTFALLPPRGNPLTFPPYYPPSIQRSAELLKKNELMMSDIPWAVAWYGNRQCVSLTLNAMQAPSDATGRENFFAINDFQKPISGLLLTPKTMDMRFQSELLESGTYGWGNFVLSTLILKEPPRSFPLRERLELELPGQLFFTDWKRWEKPDSSE